MNKNTEQFYFKAGRPFTFFVTLVPDGNGVVAQGDALSVDDVHPQTQELGGRDQLTLVGEHIQPSTIHQQKMSVGEWREDGERTRDKCTDTAEQEGMMRNRVEFID